jgi:hypothetical protein
MDMQATTCIEPTIEPEVFEVLRKNKAEAAFQTACEVARSSFPKMISLQVDLLDDPDVNGRVWVVLNVLLPPSYPWETLHQEETHFHGAMLDQVSRELNPLFGLSVRFQPE